jgi:hypothetical protein
LFLASRSENMRRYLSEQGDAGDTSTGTSSRAT